MAKAELKTKKNEASVEDFLNAIPDETAREDCKKIAELMQKVTGSPPAMWGANVVGFGSLVLKYASGRELDWMEIGFSPRKQNLTLYVMDGPQRHKELLSKLGKHKIGKGCLYFKHLSDVNEEVLEQLITNTVENMRRN